ncbi:MAG: ParB/RepB/Spo0J family partition protein [Alphaproteobacteria bacterium]|nr:ParB/RepB/Spo0J family partition protein [Alphaproteobacteria bacterium]
MSRQIKPLKDEKKEQILRTGPSLRAGRLGRGLAALLGDMGTDIEDSVPRQQQSRLVPVSFLKPNPQNPRKAFTDDQIDELSHSIQQKGIIQPLIVRALGGSDDNDAAFFEIVAGERRWRAAIKAGLKNVPVIVHILDDRETLEVALVENIQRTDLDPLEEAMGYQRLLSMFNYTQEGLARVVGRSRSHVANTLRLLKLPDSVQDHLRSGELTAGHCRTLINSDDPESLALSLVSGRMNVREAEQITRKAKSKASARSKLRDPAISILEKQISKVLDVDVSISERSEEQGTICISYKTREQLTRVCRHLDPKFSPVSFLTSRVTRL